MEAGQGECPLLPGTEKQGVAWLGMFWRGVAGHVQEQAGKAQRNVALSCYSVGDHRVYCLNWNMLRVKRGTRKQWNLIS